MTPRNWAEGRTPGGLVWPSDDPGQGAGVHGTLLAAAWSRMASSLPASPAPRRRVVLRAPDRRDRPRSTQSTRGHSSLSDFIFPSLLFG